MAEKTFADYKQDMRDFVVQYAKEQKGTAGTNGPFTYDMDLQGITDGLRSTFPKKPLLGDRVAMCYAYMHLSAVPMSPVYYKDWRKQIRAYAGEAPAEMSTNDGTLYFMLRGVQASMGEPGEQYRCAEKLLKKMTRKNRYHPEVVALMGQIARPYYNQLVDHACRKDNFATYRDQIRAFDKAFDVLLHLPTGSRYRESYNLMGKMKPVYDESEWGRQEWPHKYRSVKRRVFNSLPDETQRAMRSQRAQKDWYYK